MRQFVGGVFVGGAVVAALFWLMGGGDPGVEVQPTRFPAAPTNAPAPAADRPATNVTRARPPELLPTEAPAAPPTATTRSVVSGRVTPPADFPWTTLMMRAVWEDAPAGTDPAVARRELMAHGPDFAFRFDDVPVGRWSVSVRAPLSRTLGELSVTVGASPLTVDLAVPAPPPEQVLLVHVLGPDGAHLTNVGIDVRTDGPDGFASSGSLAAREGPGLFRVLRMERDTASGVRPTLQVTWADHWMKSVPFTPGVDRELTVRFERFAQVEVTIEGLPKASRGHVGVVLRRAGLFDSIRGPIEPGTTTDSWTFGPVEAGTYNVVLVESAANRLSSTVFPIAERTVEVRDGTNSVTIPFPALHDATLSSSDGRSGSVVLLSARLRTSWGEGRSVQLDDGGQGVVHHVPAGRYVAYLIRSDNGPEAEVVVDVPQNGVVSVLTGRTVNALRVVMTGDTGALIDAGVLDQDLIVAIDGQRFGTTDECERVVRAARRSESATVTIARGGATLDRACRTDAFGDAAVSGGVLEFASRR